MKEPRRVTLFRTAQEIDPAEVSGKIAVVIDVLRATTTIASALAAGCQRVFPARSPEEAQAIAGGLPAGSAVLGGERRGLRIAGFDLDNSPLAYTPATVGGKTVVITTTNGTEAMGRAAGAHELVAASFLTAAAITRWLAARSEPVVFCCAGTEGRPSLEDDLCAGLIIERLAAGGEPLDLSQPAVAALTAWQAVTELGSALRQTQHGQTLIDLGFAADVDCAARLDAVDVVPLRAGEALVEAR